MAPFIALSPEDASVFHIRAQVQTDHEEKLPMSREDGCRLSNLIDNPLTIFHELPHDKDKQRVRCLTPLREKWSSYLQNSLPYQSISGCGSAHFTAVSDGSGAME